MTTAVSYPSHDSSAGRHTVNGAWMILECLYRLGVRDVFGYPGGAVIPLYDEIYFFSGLRHYFCRHEQGAAHEADGYARASGKLGVCIATSGPGATNLVTGLMTAHMDSVPVLAITGQVASHLLGKDAFQESDIVGITVPITKNSYLVKQLRDIPRICKEAAYIATTGRPGPVLIDIPKDIQLATLSRSEFESLWDEPIALEGYDPTYRGHRGQIKKAVALLRHAKRPLFLVGAGVTKSHAEEIVREMARTYDIPVAMTLLGLGAFPTNDPLALGMLGMHGTVAANYATTEADVVIAAGVRFDDRIAGSPSDFCKQADIIHIDIDPAEIEKNVKVRVPIVGDLKLVLEQMRQELEGSEKPNRKPWLSQVARWKEAYPLRYTPHATDTLLPQEVLEAMDGILQGQATIVTDVGQHQMWAAQYLTYTDGHALLTSGGAGTMGFGLPAALGAQVACPDRRIVLVVGDGGLQMSIQELMLIQQYQLPVKIVLLNNSYLGMVRQWQELFNDKRYSYVNLEVNPDFQKIGEAYGVRTRRVRNREELDAVLCEVLLDDEAVLLECVVKREENVFPMIPAGGTARDIVGKKGYWTKGGE